MVIQPLIGNPYNGYINPYYWVDDHPLLYGNNGSLDPSTNVWVKFQDFLLQTLGHFELPQIVVKDRDAPVLALVMLKRHFPGGAKKKQTNCVPAKREAVNLRCES